MTSPVRLLYVITDLQVGGVPLHLFRLARAMRERGFQPAVVSLAPAGPVGEMLAGEKIPVWSCEARGRWDIRVIRRLARFVREYRPDLIHSLLFHGNLAARLAAQRVGFPPSHLLCEIQTVEVERRWHLWLDRWTHGHCRLTIGNSPSVVEHLATTARIPRDRLRLVRGGVDPCPLQTAKPIERTALGLPAEVPLVLWTGRLDPVKGLHNLIRAFRYVVSNTDAHLVLVGDGPLRRSLERAAGRAALSTHVHLLGRRTDVPAILKVADVFAFPSRTEGLPNALLEAMAAQCPIVTTDVPGCRDLITHERTGLVVRYGDVEALATAISRLLRDRRTAMALAEEACKEVTHHWHIKETFEAYASLYAEVLASAPGGL